MSPSAHAAPVRRRFLHPIWLIFSLPVYMGWRLVPAITDGTLAWIAAITALVVASLLIPLSVRLRRARPSRWRHVLTWGGVLSLGFFSTLFVVTVLRDLALLLVRVIDAPLAASLIGPSAWAAIALTAFMVLVGLWIAFRPRLVEVSIALPALPPALEGFTIALLSDIHVGPTIRRPFVKRIVERTNALGADLIAVTGDLIDGPVSELGVHTEPLGELTAPCGVFYVTGNHEYYSGEAEWTAEVRRLGLVVLKNEHVVRHAREIPIVIGGIDDPSAPRFDPTQRSDALLALRDAPADALRILLAHQPSSAHQAAQAGAHLQLSGHTHGGQYWPWNLAVPFFQPFTAGLHRLEELRIYVSRGTGFWGPPNRFGVPGEITRIELRCGAD